MQAPGRVVGGLVVGRLLVVGPASAPHVAGVERALRRVALVQHPRAPGGGEAAAVIELPVMAPDPEVTTERISQIGCQAQLQYKSRRPAAPTQAQGPAIH